MFREEYMLSGEAGCLEAEPGTLERTGKVTQKELKANVASVAAAQAFDLELGDALGPYGGAWSRNGRHLLLHGRKGHLALIDAAPQRYTQEFRGWGYQSMVIISIAVVQQPLQQLLLSEELTLAHSGFPPPCSRPLDIVKEFYVHETVRDACFLHNESLFAAAQKKHLFIYDRDGVELHCLRQVIISMNTWPLLLNVLRHLSLPLSIHDFFQISPYCWLSPRARHLPPPVNSM